MSSPPPTQIKTLYHIYRNTRSISAQAGFISPTCLQICRPIPSFSATSREQIVRYSEDAQSGTLSLDSNPPPEKDVTERDESDSRDDADSASIAKERGETSPANLVYTIRQIVPSDHAWDMSDTVISSIDLTPTALETKAKDEDWIGMRVDLWDDAPSKGTLLVKVNYWWRWEAVQEGEEMEGDTCGYGWRQCLHDIVYLGPKDGTEREDGMEMLFRAF
jgi:hypothetical protein